MAAGPDTGLTQPISVAGQIEVHCFLAKCRASESLAKIDSWLPLVDTPSWTITLRPMSRNRRVRSGSQKLFVSGLPASHASQLRQRVSHQFATTIRPNRRHRQHNVLLAVMQVCHGRSRLLSWHVYLCGDIFTGDLVVSAE